MPTPSLPGRHATSLLCVLLAAGTVVSAFADWPPNGDRIDPAVGTPRYDRIGVAADGPGGLLLNMDVVSADCSRVLGSGAIAAGWPTAPPTPPGFVSDPVPDGQGGAYIAISSMAAVSLAQASDVRLEVFDVNGRIVQTLADGTLPSGAHTRDWDGRDGASRDVAPGLYFIPGRLGREVANARVLRIR